jgi:hypothetical protein
MNLQPQPRTNDLLSQPRPVCALSALDRCFLALPAGSENHPKLIFCNQRRAQQVDVPPELPAHRPPQVTEADSTPIDQRPRTKRLPSSRCI